MLLKKGFLKKKEYGTMLKLILELVLIAILGICFAVVLLYSFVVMIHVSPIIIIFIIAYKIYDKITENDIKVD